MPRGDGTGPMGKGPGTGQGMGRKQGGGAGRMGGAGLGIGGSCVCTKCGKTVPHKQGIPCNQMTCSECGTPMTRQR